MSRVIPAFAQFFDGAGDPLVDGWLQFLESGSNNTDKNTYADSDQIIANTNPVQLDGEGRCPNVFGTGAYRVISFHNDPEDEETPGEQVQMFDPVSAPLTALSSTVNSSGFAAYSALITYGLSDIVLSGVDNYRSLATGNLNNNPPVSPTVWEQVVIVGVWNLNISYPLGALTKDDVAIYMSLQNANINQDPTVSPLWWRVI